MVGFVAGSNLTLDCEVVKGHPKPSLSWWGECKQRGRIFLKLEPLGENLIYEYVIFIIFYNWTSMFNVYSVPKLIPHKFFFHKCFLIPLHVGIVFYCPVGSEYPWLTTPTSLPTPMAPWPFSMSLTWTRDRTPAWYGTESALTSPTPISTTHIQVTTYYLLWSNANCRKSG